ncbi:unnamed protein product [Chrysoparadoxa australica]
MRSKGKDNYGQTLLHTAVLNSQQDILELLLTQGKLDPNAFDSVTNRMTPLMMALQRVNQPISIMLVKHGAKLDITDANGDTVLHWAARSTSATAIRQLLGVARKGGEAKSSVLKLLGAKNNRGKTPPEVANSSTSQEVLASIRSGETEITLPLPSPSNSNHRRSTRQRKPTMSGAAGRKGTAPAIVPRPSLMLRSSQHAPSAISSSPGHRTSILTKGMAVKEQDGARQPAAVKEVLSQVRRLKRCQVLGLTPTLSPSPVIAREL